MLRFKTICLLAPLAIKVNMLVGNGVMCVAMTQLILERAAAILYHMHYFLFRKKFKHSENACFPEEKQLEEVGFERRILHQYAPQTLVRIGIDVEIYTTFRFAERNLCKFLGGDSLISCNKCTNN